MHLENLSDGLTPRVKCESMSQERSFVFTLQAILTDAPNQMHIRLKTRCQMPSAQVDCSRQNDKVFPVFSLFSSVANDGKNGINCLAIC
jgi:hypothetical protein